MHSHIYVFWVLGTSKVHCLEKMKKCPGRGQDDIYFTTTRPGPRRGAAELEPMSKFCDPSGQCHLYRIAWSSLVTGPRHPAS